MDKDIQEMFSQKNREILIHNLELDIERNMEVLKDTLTNIFNLQFDIAIKNIVSIYDNEVQRQDIAKVLVPLKSKSFLLLNDQINVKQAQLLEQIKNLEFKEEQMDIYYETVFESTSPVIQVFESDDISELLKISIGDLFNLYSGIDNTICKRLEDYIHLRLFGKLREKVEQEFLIRDNNLSNKGKESYLKFQELQERTTNIKVVFLYKKYKNF